MFVADPNLEETCIEEPLIQLDVTCNPKRTKPIEQYDMHMDEMQNAADIEQLVRLFYKES